MPFLFHFWGLNGSGKRVILDIKAWKWKFWCLVEHVCVGAAFLPCTSLCPTENIMSLMDVEQRKGSGSSDYKQCFLFDAFDSWEMHKEGKKCAVNKQTQHNKNRYLLFNPWSSLWKWRLEEQHFPAMQVWLGIRKGWIGAVEQAFVSPPHNF